MEILWWILAVILLTVGVCASLYPALPAVPLAYLGLYLIGLQEGFQRIDALTMLVLAFLALVSIAFDSLVIGLKMPRRAATRPGIIGALLGATAGALFSPVWIIGGAFAGSLCGEIFHIRKEAQKPGLSVWVWLVFGVAAKLALILLMLFILIASFF